MNSIYDVSTLEQMKIFANELAQHLQKGDFILLEGTLGSGKTTCTRFVLEACGVNDRITSPSFALVKEYETDHFRIYHIDAYRLTGSDPYIEDLCDDEDALICVEWPNHLDQSLYTRRRHKIQITQRNTQREITYECHY